MNSEIYTITVFSDMLHLRCMGFFYNLDKAVFAVTHNDLDIFEDGYDYAVIEKFPEGLYPNGEVIGYYEFNEDKERYVPCDTPKGFDLISNFALG